MRIDEYQSYDATGLAGLIARGEVTADQVLDAAFEAIKHREPALGAVVATCEEQARAAVEGLLPGVLAGVPYLIKDLECDVAGMATSNGSRLFADKVATRDSTLVTRLRAAGVLIVGKTNTPEFGLGTSTEPGLWGPARNPWHPDRSAGGSSGGSAAAVAAGMVPVAHATDGGGSIRIPAACCGVFGLKPSRGRVTSGPDHGESWAGLAAAHAVTRTVRDSATLLDVTGTPEPGDPYYAPAPAGPYAAEVGADPGRLRIGLNLSPVDADLVVDAECVRAAEEAAALCVALGHDVDPVEWPDAVTRPGEVIAPISAAHIARIVDLRLAELGRDLAPGDLDAATAMIVDKGRRLPLARYLAAIDTMHAIGRAVARLTARYDVLLTPTMAVVPPVLGELDPNRDPVGALRGMRGMAAFTSLFNVTGQPAMSVPLGRTADGLPLGVQFAGRYGDEATLLRLAGQLEVAAPWAGTAVG
ncbi:amidase [Embleya sp. NBC_00896]|uniref:amidase n=1 Tax=Embleya sp. NBC_00896 TaxID=2975961 RepID=UPI00386FD24D|nr:amidase [Embleya sp. NBC_00896]